MQNGGELSISDNGDIYVTRQTEELYSNSDWTDSFTTKDIYFINITKAEVDNMSSYEFDQYKSRMIGEILRKYVRDEDRELEFTNPEEFYKRLGNIDAAKVYFTV